MKNLRLVFRNTDGQKQDITMPMEKWIRDWWYECDFVPENGEVPEIAELDGKDILKDFPDYANSFEDIAYKYMWDGFHDDFYGDVKAGKVEDNGDSFEQWLKENVRERKIDMLKVGDTVKVIAATEDAGYCDGRKIEYIPIGTICTVVETDFENDGTQSCAVDNGKGVVFWYKAEELEKGHLEWIKGE